MKNIKKQIRKLSKKEAIDISWSIDNEGFDYYFDGYSSGDEFDGTAVEAPLKDYLEAKANLMNALEDEGILLGENLSSSEGDLNDEDEVEFYHDEDNCE